MTYLDFFNLIEIKEEDKESAIYFMNHKGIGIHIEIAKFLNSFTKKTVTYNEVATTFRYDKRIRKILYNYIGFIEEAVRSYVSNKYEKMEQLSEKCIKQLSARTKTKIKDKSYTYDALSYCGFNEIFLLFEALGNDDTGDAFPYLDSYIKKNREALNTLRNQMSHNKFLLSNFDLLEVTLPKGEKNNSLIANLRNVISFLPPDIRQKFIKEINEARLKRNNKFSRQVEWKLPKEIIIKL